MLLRGVIFDVHGTIIDKGSRETLMQALANAADYLAEQGYNITFEDYFRVWSSNLKRIAENKEDFWEPNFNQWQSGIFRDLGMSDYDESSAQNLNKRFMEAFASATKALPHAHEVLAELKKEYLLGIASNSMAQNTALDLERTGLHGYFDVVLTSSEIGRRKPHPLLFQETLARLKLKVEEAVLVGDHPIEDIGGAHQVGMRAILVCHPQYGLLPDFLPGEPHPEAVITDFRELKGVLSRL